LASPWVGYPQQDSSERGCKLQEIGREGCAQWGFGGEHRNGLIGPVVSTKQRGAYQPDAVPTRFAWPQSALEASKRRAEPRHCGGDRASGRIRSHVASTSRTAPHGRLKRNGPAIRDVLMAVDQIRPAARDPSGWRAAPGRRMWWVSPTPLASAISRGSVDARTERFDQVRPQSCGVRTRYEQLGRGTAGRRTSDVSLGERSG